MLFFRQEKYVHSHKQYIEVSYQELPRDSDSSIPLFNVFEVAHMQAALGLASIKIDSNFTATIGKLK